MTDSNLWRFLDFFKTLHFLHIRILKKNKVYFEDTRIFIRQRRIGIAWNLEEETDWKNTFY